MKYKSVLLIGAGSIGALKPDDVDNEKSKYPLTWINAINRCARTELIGVVDSDPVKLDKVIAKWGNVGGTWTNTNQAFKFFKQIEKQIDIIVIATSTNYHYSILQEIVDMYPSKLVICEKPFCNSINEARDIKCRYFGEAVPIIVNYSRRNIPFYQKIKRFIVDKIYGNVQNCTVHYNRGLLRDGCHALNICNYFFGDLIIKHNLPVTINDFSDTDLTESFFLKYSDCPAVYFIPCDGRKSSIFNIKIVLEKGIIEFVDSGNLCEVTEIKKSDYGDYAAFNFKERDVIDTDLKNCLLYSLEKACDIVNGKKTDYCTDIEAIKVHENINYIRRA